MITFLILNQRLKKGYHFKRWHNWWRKWCYSKSQENATILNGDKKGDKIGDRRKVKKMSLFQP